MVAGMPRTRDPHLASHVEAYVVDKRASNPKVANSTNHGMDDDVGLEETRRTSRCGGNATGAACRGVRARRPQSGRAQTGWQREAPKLN